MATDAAILAEAMRYFREHKAEISTFLGKPVEGVTFVLDSNLGPETPAMSTGGQEIHLNPTWLKANIGQLEGLVVHEVTHIMADNDREQLADAARYAIVGEESGWKAQPQAIAIAKRRTAEVTGTSEGAGPPQAPGQSSRGAGGYAGNWGVNDPDENGTRGLTGAEKMIQDWIDAQTEDTKANFRSFLDIAQGFGLSVNDPQMLQLAKEAANKGYDQGTYMFYLRQTAEYQVEFPGIFRKDGTMKMSEDQYSSNAAQYESIAAQSGLDYGPQQQAWLFQNNVSPGEYSVKAPAVARMKRDPQLFASYRRELIQSGVKPSEVTRDGMLRAVLGMGNAAWKDVWQDAITRNASIDAGIAIKAHGKAQGYTSLTQGQMEKISGKDLSEEEMAQGFGRLAEELLTSLPLSKIQGYGLSKQDLVAASFGGKGSARVRKLVQHIADQEKVFYEDRSAPAVQAIPTGGAQVAAPRPQTA